ncbi:MAG: hypothetical protein C0599_09965 [Salinivirgaceae bacterium]|nr:MAG: hypothetical protein C0599_09965 [Salinivirgaceae bacterium]
MKKLIAIIASVAFMLPAMAQDVPVGSASSGEKVVNKNGVAILPTAGDIAIGIDMVPFLNYFGNIANQTVNNSYNGSFLSNANTLFGKYFLQSDLAVRGRFMIMSNIYQDKRYILDDAAFFNDPNTNDQVVDVRHFKDHDYMLGFGIEKRRGKGRLRGIFAAEASLMFGTNKTEYTYGNNYSDLNTTPGTTNFGGNIAANGRVLQDNNGSYFGAGIGAFIGVEYFIMPNIAIGSEVGWGVNFTKWSQSNTVTEVWNGNSGEEVTTLDSPGDLGFNYGLNNPTASLYMMFHF